MSYSPYFPIYLMEMGSLLGNILGTVTILSHKWDPYVTVKDLVIRLVLTIAHISPKALLSRGSRSCIGQEARFAGKPEP